jgi:hypothetical protein
MPYRNLRLRYPYEVFLLVWCIAVGIPAAFGVQTSAAARKEMAPLEVRLWSISMVIGAVIALCGIFWGRRNAKSQMTGLILEEVGLIIVGFAALVYAIVIWKGTGPAGLFAIGIVAGFATASFAQALMLYRAVQRAAASYQHLTKGANG